MTTAQDTLIAMLRESVAPALRDLGFKGSGQNCHLPSDDVWALVGFQKSQWSEATKLTFTANITVASRRIWATARETRNLPERPSANGSCRRSFRLSS
jgi:hypothetical protein